MDRKKKNILVWFIAWAGLLVLVLYSPYGSPEMYKPRYMESYQGVRFDENRITNAPDYKKNGSNRSQRNYNAQIANDNTVYSVPSASGGNSYPERPVFDSPDNYTPNQLTQRSGYSQGNAIASGTSGRTESRYAPSIVSGGLLSQAGDMTKAGDNNATRQGSGNTNGPGGTTDPGGDPLGDPIPVGDGWVFLMIVAALYVFLKRLVFTK